MENLNSIRSHKINYRNAVLFLIWFLIIIAKIVQFLILPSKYFNDSNTIMRFMIYTPSYVDTGFRFTASFFRRINVLRLSSLQSWAMFITVPFGIVTYRLISKNTKYVDLRMFVFICSNIFLISVYVFNISKEILQYSIFLLIYIIIKNATHKHKYLFISMCSIVFVFESIVFRSYYIITAALSLSLFVIVDLLNSKKVRIRSGVIALIAISVFILFLFMSVAKYIMPSEYVDVLNVRSTVNLYREGADDAVTLITDIINNNGNLLLWLLNYIITAVRLLLPLELLMKSVIYFPYVIFQILLTLYIIFSWKKIFSVRENNVKFNLAVCVFSAFFLTSVMFEPDFGSWVRHESTTLPITILFICQLTSNKLHDR